MMTLSIDDANTAELTTNYNDLRKPLYKGLANGSTKNKQGGQNQNADIMLEKLPLVEARVQIFSQLLNLIENELSKCSSIEWEERIFFHTVMMRKIGPQVASASMSTPQEQLPNRSQTTQNLL